MRILRVTRTGPPGPYVSRLVVALMNCQLPVHHLHSATATHGSCGWPRVRDGQTVTCTAPSRNRDHDQAAPGAGRTGQPDRRGRGDRRQPLQLQQLHHAAVAGPPSAHPAGLHPGRACWLNLQEGWWRLYRRGVIVQSRPAPARHTMVEEATTRWTGQHATRWTRHPLDWSSTRP